MVAKKPTKRNPKLLSDPTCRTSEDLQAEQAMLHKGQLIMQKLEEVYPQVPEGFLHHTNPFTLLIAVVLSAQSLDIKVNEITPELFRIAETPEKMCDLGEARIRDLIKRIGLAPQKAKNIAKLSEVICERFGGKVPQTFEELESLAGVGHKTASVVMMQAFKKPAFPVDTHIHRLACRWGCGDAKSVEKTEAALKRWFPDPSTWGELHVRIILFGREFCPARKHDMELCPICSFAATEESRRLNNVNANKFVAAAKHSNPYSVRDVPPVSIVRKVQVQVKEEYKAKESRSSKKRKNKVEEDEKLQDQEEEKSGGGHERPRTRQRRSVVKSVVTKVESEAAEKAEETVEEMRAEVVDGMGVEDRRSDDKVVAMRRSQRLLTKKASRKTGGASGGVGDDGEEEETFATRSSTEERARIENGTDGRRRRTRSSELRRIDTE